MKSTRETDLHSLSDYNISSSNNSVVHEIHRFCSSDARTHLVIHTRAARQDLRGQELPERIRAPLNIHHSFCYLLVFYLLTKNSVQYTFLSADISIIYGCGAGDVVLEKNATDIVDCLPH